MTAAKPKAAATPPSVLDKPETSLPVPACQSPSVVLRFVAYFRPFDLQKAGFRCSTFQSVYSVRLASCRYAVEIKCTRNFAANPSKPVDSCECTVLGRATVSLQRNLCVPTILNHFRTPGLADTACVYKFLAVQFLRFKVQAGSLDRERCPAILKSHFLEAAADQLVWARRP